MIIVIFKVDYNHQTLKIHMFDTFECSKIIYIEDQSFYLNYFYTHTSWDIDPKSIICPSEVFLLCPKQLKEILDP